VSSPTSALELVAISKDYHSLRPLRIERLVLDRGDRAALLGLDAPAAEVLVALLTGAMLPDAGDIRVDGESTKSLTSETEWLAWLDRFGVVSHRAVLIEGASVAQNMAIPFTLDIDPLAPEIDGHVRRLAAEVDLPPSALDEPVGRTDAALRMRVHLARALALDPALLLLEHPTIAFAEGASEPFGRIVARVAQARNLTVLAITADDRFARAAVTRRFDVNPATGALKAKSRWF
jgi:ABC-type transporter Mla maintaining outer membrane lipid asymmetry ATPase subunit MlaF